MSPPPPPQEKGTIYSHSVVLVDLNEFSSVFSKCSILTQDIRKQPRSNLLRMNSKGKLSLKAH